VAKRVERVRMHCSSKSGGKEVGGSKVELDLFVPLASSLLSRRRQITTKYSDKPKSKSMYDKRKREKSIQAKKN